MVMTNPVTRPLLHLGSDAVVMDRSYPGTPLLGGTGCKFTLQIN